MCEVGVLIRSLIKLMQLISVEHITHPPIINSTMTQSTVPITQEEKQGIGSAKSAKIYIFISRKDLVTMCNLNGVAWNEELKHNYHLTLQLPSALQSFFTSFISLFFFFYSLLSFGSSAQVFS